MAVYPPPPSPPPIFPTHSASLALHLLGLNGSWECCDVMRWCTERTASPFFFLPSSLSCESDSSSMSNYFPFRPCLRTAFFLLKGEVCYIINHKMICHQILRKYAKLAYLLLRQRLYSTANMLTFEIVFPVGNNCFCLPISLEAEFKFVPNVCRMSTHVTMSHKESLINF